MTSSKIRNVTLLLSLAAGIVTASAPASSQQLPPIQDNVAPPSLPGEMKLKTSGPSLTTSRETWLRLGDAYVVHNVGQPTLTPFLPPAGKANGTAVLIAPGGGFMMLSMSSEGVDVARWLASKGIAAFVLKYRLLPTPSDAAGTMTAIMRSIMDPDKQALQARMTSGTRVAVEDASEAMRVVRANATRWGIDPAKVGFMGFSAGAFTTIGLVAKADTSTMPNFVAPIYGSMNAPAEALPSKVPPMWASMASDDPILGNTDFGLLNTWKSKGGTVEFHLYEKGGHGYGFAGTPGTSSVTWPAAFLAWLQARGLYTVPASQK